MQRPAETPGPLVQGLDIKNRKINIDKFIYLRHYAPKLRKDVMSKDRKLEYNGLSGALYHVPTVIFSAVSGFNYAAGNQLVAACFAVVTAGWLVGIACSPRPGPE